MTMDVSDTMLMAYADGELDEETRQALDRALDGNSRLRERLAVFTGSRTASRAAYDDILNAAVPTLLLKTIREFPIDGSPTDGQLRTDETRSDRPFASASTFDRPVSKADRLSGAGGSTLRARRRGVFAGRATSRTVAWPLAACLLLGAGFGGGFLIGGDASTGTRSLAGAPALSERLGTQPSGYASTREVAGLGAVTLLGSYETEAGLCRVFSVGEAEQTLRGVGCDRGAGYQVELLIADRTDGQAGTGGFVPASDRAAASLDTYLETIEARGPLGLDEEADRLGPAE